LKRELFIYGLISLFFIIIFFYYLQRYYYHYDDAFITYTFADNLAHGYGIVLHPSFSPIQVSSTLFYTIILAFLHILSNIDIHIIGMILSIVFFSLINILTMILFRHIFPILTQGKRLVFFIILFLFQMPLYFSLGLEIIFLNFVFLLILYILFCKNNIIIASLILSFVHIIRLDYAFFVPAFIFIFFLKTRNIKQSLIYITPVIISIICYLVFAWCYFGELVPHSWIAKSYLPANVSGVISLKSYILNISYMIFFGLGLISIIYFVTYFSITKNYELLYLSFLTILIFCVIYLFILEYKGAPDMPWYMVSLIYCVQYLIWYMAYSLLSRKFVLKFGIFIILSVYGSFLGMSYYSKKMSIQVTKEKFSSKLWHNDRREKSALFLRDSIPNIKDKKILLYEAGKIPYYTHAKCYDVLGLVSREALQGLKEKNTTITLNKIKPDFIVGVNNINYSPMAFLRSEEFKSRYTILKEIDGYIIWKLK